MGSAGCLPLNIEGFETLSFNFSHFITVQCRTNILVQLMWPRYREGDGGEAAE